MGFGDELMLSGQIKHFAEEGKVAVPGFSIFMNHLGFLFWSRHAEEIFLNNPNILNPRNLCQIKNGLFFVLNSRFRQKPNFCFVENYPGNRPYHLRKQSNRYIFNYDFIAKPGQIFFTPYENKIIEQNKKRYSNCILIEPNTKCEYPSLNKKWPTHKFQNIVNYLIRRGYCVIQLDYGLPLLKNVTPIRISSFRESILLLAAMDLYIGPEGGIHHAAAAINIPAVVIFGGFTPPQITGYKSHYNIGIDTGSGYCGSLNFCQHCNNIMKNKITEDHLKSGISHVLNG